MNLTKNLMFCFLAASFFSLKSQNSDILKAFINENDIAVRSVQKNSILLEDPNNDNYVKELLKLQIASVNSFESNPKKSADIAFFVRETCKDFLTKNAKTSLDYLVLTDKEKTFFSSPNPVETSSIRLNKNDQKKIESLNVKDPQIFDDLNTRIK